MPLFYFQKHLQKKKNLNKHLKIQLIGAPFCCLIKNNIKKKVILV